jgi:hypothetical protein
MWDHQPKRDLDNQFNYRTWPLRNRYVVSGISNVIVQTGLYRYTFAEQWPLMIGAGDLHDCLFSSIEGISKRHVGATILRAVNYDPRKLKGATENNEKAQQTYCIEKPEDLRYGLEWMICSWLPTFLRATVVPEDLPRDAEGYSEELEMIRDLTDEDWSEQIVTRLLTGEVKLREPAWDKVSWPESKIHQTMRMPKDLSRSGS